MGQVEIEKKIYAFWCRYPSQQNFGDGLTPWLVKKITGQHPGFLWPAEPVLKHLVVGSIICYSNEFTSVWGAGILQAGDPVSPKASLLAVRGPLTRARALSCGAACPEVYGDPALLLPQFYQPQPTGATYKLGIVPHYLDKPLVAARRVPSPDIFTVDIQRPVEEVINAIAACRYILSSSLHGLVAAQVYEIPALWVKFSDRPHGDGSKFHDYFLSTGQEPYSPLSVTKVWDGLLEWVHRIPPPRLEIDLDPLWQACPFRSDR